MRATIVLFPLILPVIKCYMNLLKLFNSFISSLRALDISVFAVIDCFWEDVTGCFVYYLVCLYSQTECLYIPHIFTFLSGHKLSCFNLCCVAPSCLTPLYVSTLWYIFLIDTGICFWVLPNRVSPPGWVMDLQPLLTGQFLWSSWWPLIHFLKFINDFLMSGIPKNVHSIFSMVWQVLITKGIIPLLSQLTVPLAKDVAGPLCCQGALLAHTHTLSIKRPTYHF